MSEANVLIFPSERASPPLRAPGDANCQVLSLENLREKRQVRRFRQYFDQLSYIYAAQIAHGRLYVWIVLKNGTADSELPPCSWVQRVSLDLWDPHPDNRRQARAEFEKAEFQGQYLLLSSAKLSKKNVDFAMGADIKLSAKTQLQIHFPGAPSLQVNFCDVRRVEKKKKS